MSKKNDLDVPEITKTWCAPSGKKSWSVFKIIDDVTIRVGTYRSMWRAADVERALHGLPALGINAVVREATRLASREVLAPKCVRDGTVTKKRAEPMLSDDEIRPKARWGVNSWNGKEEFILPKPLTPEQVRDIYEGQLAKNRELIQRFVDHDEKWVGKECIEADREWDAIISDAYLALKTDQ